MDPTVVSVLVVHILELMLSSLLNLGYIWYNSPPILFSFIVRVEYQDQNVTVRLFSSF